MDVLTFIKESHRKIREGIAQAAEVKGVRERRTAVTTVESALKVHLELEKQYLFPELSDLFPGVDTAIKTALAASQTVKRRLTPVSQLVNQPAGSQLGFEDKIGALSESVERHFELIEQVLIPRMRSLIRTEEREDLGDLFQEVAAELARSSDPAAKAEPVRRKQRA